jgi:hypothetical protein
MAGFCFSGGHFNAALRVALGAMRLAGCDRPIRRASFRRQK